MKTIVIVGGGAGGLELLVNLRRKKPIDLLRILLVDCSLSHVWKPLLHEIAAGTLNSEFNEVDYTGLLANLDCDYIYGKCSALDRKNKTLEVAAVTDEHGAILLPVRKFNYDYCVLAVGSRANSFGIAGVLDNCSFIDSLEEAKRFRSLLLNKMIQQSQGEIKSIDIIIVGGGATGTELAAELQHVFNLLKHYGDATKKDNIKIKLIETSSRLLANLPEKLSNAIKINLEKMHIDILTNTKVSKVNTNSLETEKGDIYSFDFCIWAAGIQSRLDNIDLNGLETNKISQLDTFATLQSKQDPAIFALGDCAACPQVKGEGFVPPRAQAAHQQATYLSSALIGLLNGKPLIKPYQYKDYGTLINLSNATTHGILMGKFTSSFYLQGKLARWIYLSLYQSHLIKVYGTIKVIINLFINFLSKKTRSKYKFYLPNNSSKKI